MHQQEALGNGTFDRMMLMHDGAPIHRAQVVTQWLEANVTLMCSQPCQQDVRIGRNPFTLNWPPYRGAFNDYVDKIWSFFDHILPTSMWTFLTLNGDKNRDFLDHLLPLLVHVVIEGPLNLTKDLIIRGNIMKNFSQKKYK